MSPLNYVFYQDCVALLSAPFRFLFLVLLAYSAIYCVQNLYVESRGGAATIQETTLMHQLSYEFFSLQLANSSGILDAVGGIKLTSSEPVTI